MFISNRRRRLPFLYGGKLGGTLIGGVLVWYAAMWGLSLNVDFMGFSNEALGVIAAMTCGGIGHALFDKK